MKITGNPLFNYFLYHTQNPVQKNSRAWETPVPVNRRNFRNEEDIFISYGDYFSSVHSFLTKNRCEIITSAVSLLADQDVKTEDIKEINVCLEKHGEFYHPARVEVCADRTKFLFVVNAAFSSAGKNGIEKEYNILKRLNNEYPYSFIPKIYGEGRACLNKSLEIRMFMGEWFEGYNEFHLSHSPLKPEQTDTQKKIVVWDTEKGNYFLSKEKTMELYEQASMILTSYYNFETFEQIFPWHHGAGDFVVKVCNDKTDLKLITARGYFSLVQTPDSDPDSILGAMLLFLLNLSIRMRLDRLDGIGDIAWSEDIAVKGTVKGFFRGLALQSQAGLLPDQFDVFFRNYLSSCTLSDLSDLFSNVVNTYNPGAPEFPIIKQNLKNHTDSLYRFVNPESSF
ncbi:MAG: hypothetical protein GY795_51550 [Desulfobacterales bacterium]|nr:hypothetical protein [Desulfobacterales bacterium]